MQARKNTLRFVVSIAKNKPAWREWNEEDQNAKDGWYRSNLVEKYIDDAATVETKFQRRYITRKAP
ncbi:hypothetical protein N0V91_011068 [Didymella pomorum]|uniref:Uncharacterized protein n=1 Tax=Didymella pomorum TaxID=749634 RepID=A0A9W8YY53_9PLEO|nr:hypothetical protein N0V91_011068 [Didymella pomorum]